jgi:uncharacterized protein (TIGR04255 family)
LQEVIFEAFWDLDVDEKSHAEYDPGFELAQGIFSNHLMKDYPHHIKVAPPLIPLQLLNFKPVHQFWSAPKEWPVIQLGPGILAANVTEKKYIWESVFRPVILQALNALLSSYKEVPRFNKLSLRYIDAVDLEPENNQNFPQFIEKNLQLKIDRKFEIPGKIAGQSVSQIYQLEDGSKLEILVTNGARNEKPAVIWQTAIVKEQSFSPDKIREWIVYAHSTISDLFRRMLRKEYYDSLK